ncbi:hypothetical protein [Kitasatospora sp. NPDC085464]|uniref:hypothetical protein n=1 Tax=Kitasatospora sp. NPDC085464 TaxID=3364063 RepID=UPI0037C72CB9
MATRSTTKASGLSHRLFAAAAFLKELGTPEAAEHAAAVAEAAARESRVRSRPGNPTLTLYVHADTWRQAQDDATPDHPVTAEVDEGLQLFLAGKFIPERPVRAKRGTSAKETVTVRSTTERRDEVATYAQAQASERGWEPTVNQVAAAWLEHRYPPR